MGIFVISNKKPQEIITPDMDVQDFFLMYYNPWDANYLGLVTVTYEAEEYRTEVDRLSAYSSTEYIGCYGATGVSVGGT